MIENFFIALTQTVRDRAAPPAVVAFVLDGQSWTLNTRSSIPVVLPGNSVPTATGAGVGVSVDATLSCPIAVLLESRQSFSTLSQQPNVQMHGDKQILHKLFPAIAEAAATVMAQQPALQPVVITTPSHDSSNALATHWIPDDLRTHCTQCKSLFNWLRRRHHCRGCGDVFCADCTAYRVCQSRMCFKCFRVAVNRSKVTAESSQYAAVDIDDSTEDAQGILVARITQRMGAPEPIEATPTNMAYQPLPLSVRQHARLKPSPLWLAFSGAVVLASLLLTDLTPLWVSVLLGFLLAAVSLWQIASVRAHLIVATFILPRIIPGPWRNRSIDEALLLARLSSLGGPWSTLTAHIRRRPDVAVELLGAVGGAINTICIRNSREATSNASLGASISSGVANDCSLSSPYSSTEYAIMTASTAKELIARELGKSFEEIFSAFGNMVIKSDSCHCSFSATLRTGSKAVRVTLSDPKLLLPWQRNLSAMLRLGDLLQQRGFCPTLGRLMVEWAQHMMSLWNNKECDERFGRLLQRSGSQTHGPPASPVANLTTHHVQVMEMPLCFPLTDESHLSHYKINKEVLFRQLCRTYAHLSCNLGLVCDDVSYLEVAVEGNAARLVLTSMPHTVNSEERLVLSQVLFYSCVRDIGGLLHSLSQLGLGLQVDIPLALAVMRLVCSSSKESSSRQLHLAYTGLLPRSLAYLLVGLRELQYLGVLWGCSARPIIYMRDIAQLSLVHSVAAGQHARRPMRPIANLACHLLESTLRGIIRSLHTDDQLSGMQVAVFYKGKFLISF